jgi:multidrug efflux pump subunit AcrB
LQIVKKSGENILSASRKVYETIKRAKKEGIVSKDLKITATNDQSDTIKKQLNGLENSMIMSILFVVIVLFFFLGTRNALFVGIAIPMSMFLSFVVLGALGFKINMVVLFGLILALGMLVDNAIVVVENIYRFIDEGYSKYEAAKLGVGEVAVPIIASTATTLAAFTPLIFWDSIMGEFMKYLPITLIIVLTSSLFVALVINPVISSTFIKGKNEEGELNKKRAFKILLTLTIVAIPFYFLEKFIIANLLMISAIVTGLNVLILNRIGKWFQNVFLTKLENIYSQILRFSIVGKTPYFILAGAFALLFFTIILLKIRNPKKEFFPDSDPNYINIKAEMPTGTDILATDAFMKRMYVDLLSIIKDDTIIIKSIVTNVGEGAKTQDKLGGTQAQAFEGLITLSIIDYEKREGRSSGDLQKRISNQLINHYPGIKISILKDKKGPPTGKPVNIEISGKDYQGLIKITKNIEQLINAQNIKGIEGLHMDLETGKPEMLIHIDREAARRFGLSTGMIASTIRTALFGKEVSDFKDGEDEYPIQLRLKESQRYSIPALMNFKITFRNKKGKIMQIPISSVASFSYNTTYGAVKRKDLDRVITLYSNIVEGYNANDINDQLKELLSKQKNLIPEGYQYKFTGQQEQQAESMAFLGKAFAIAIAFILLILVSQFNSLVKPLIILTSVLLSTIGVFGGIATFGMTIIVVMTGIGVVSLAGVVVNNAIVLIDFIEQARKRGVTKTAAIIKAGVIRMRPVLLTAVTTVSPNCPSLRRNFLFVEYFRSG